MSVTLDNDKDFAVENINFGAEKLKTSVREWYDHVQEVAQKTDTLSKVKIKLEGTVDGRTAYLQKEKFKQLDEAIFPTINKNINEYIVSTKIDDFINATSKNLKETSSLEVICKASAYGVSGACLSSKEWVMTKAATASSS